jgi:type IV pilus assembly protein PilX
MRPRQDRQDGAVLIIGLIVLLLLNLLVASGIQMFVLQEKMVAATFDGHVAREEAESAVRDAANFIETLINTSGFSDSGDGGLYTEGNGPTDYFASAVWAADKVRAGNSVNGGTPPSYIVMHLGELSLPIQDPGEVNLLNAYGQTSGGGTLNGFRIVARSTGASGSAVRIVVATYGTRL